MGRDEAHYNTEFQTKQGEVYCILGSIRTACSCGCTDAAHEIYASLQPFQAGEFKWADSSFGLPESLPTKA